MTAGIEAAIAAAAKAVDWQYWCGAQHYDGYTRAWPGHGDSPSAESVTDTAWGAVQALIRTPGGMRGAVDVAIALLERGEIRDEDLPDSAIRVVDAWIAEREVCADYVREHLVDRDGVAHVHGAPLGAWAYALHRHDWAVLSFTGRDGLAFSVAGSRRLDLDHRRAVIAEINKRLTALEGAGAHWAGVPGLTGSRGRTTLATEVVCGVVRAVADSISP